MLHRVESLSTDFGTRVCNLGRSWKLEIEGCVDVKEVVCGY